MERFLSRANTVSLRVSPAALVSSPADWTVEEEFILHRRDRRTDGDEEIYLTGAVGGITI
jgi:hypothetical protein